MTALAQPSLFDAAESQRRRDAGISAAMGTHGIWLRHARDVAVQLAQRDGTVSADSLRAAGITPPPGASPNIFGGLFSRDSRFVFVEFMRSDRKIAPRNLLAVWRLASSVPPIGSRETVPTYAESQGPALTPAS